MGSLSHLGQRVFVTVFGVLPRRSWFITRRQLVNPVAVQGSIAAGGGLDCL